MSRTTRPITQREANVLAGIARGHSYPQIADRLGVQPATIRSHAERMRSRYQVHTRAALVALGYQRGWLTALEPEPRRSLHLPLRQQQILQAAANGLTRAEIAKLLGIAHNTVYSHCRRMFEAMDADTLAHAVALGYQHGLLQLPTADAA